MKKSFKVKTSPSMFRSKIKKSHKGNLPTRIMRDPFVGLMYYNRNGRTIKVNEDSRVIGILK